MNLEYFAKDNYPEDYICDCALCEEKDVEFWTHKCKFLVKGGKENG